MLLICGMPMYIMEVALGQYISEGPIQVWRAVCPLLRGNIFCINVSIYFLL